MTNPKNAAQDYNRFDSRSQAAEPIITALPENQNIRRPKIDKRPYIAYGMLLLLCFGVIMVILSGYAQVTELTAKNDALKADITDLQARQKVLEARREQMYTLNYVENYAKNQLGMVKLDKSTVEYIELENEEVTDFSVSTTSLPEVLKSLKNGLSILREYIG